MTITLHNLDCLPEMRKMPDRAFELAIVDPPYFSGPDKLGYYGEIISNTKVKRQSYKTMGNWTVPGIKYFNELLRVSEHQIVWGFNYFKISNLGPGRIIWDKINGASSFSDGEIAYCSIIDTVRFFRLMWNGMIQHNMKNKEIRIHPTQKPVALYEWLLKNYAKPGDRILDTHSGSLSIGIACYNLGFDLTAYEIDKEYFDAGKARLERHMAQGRLFETKQGRVVPTQKALL